MNSRRNNGPRIDIVKYRAIWFSISLLLTIPGLIGIGASMVKYHTPLKLGIDFTGGSILQYQFVKDVTLQQVRSVLEEAGFEGSQVQEALISNHEVIVMRTKAIDSEAEKKKLDDALEKNLGEFKVLSVDKVSATVGPELLQNGLISLLLAFAMMVVYITYRFKSDYAWCAIAALAHDTIVLCGIWAILGIFCGTETDSLFIPALLTVIGFSVHDTIVVFDRIRENSKYIGKKIKDPETGKEIRKDFGDVANDSVTQTLARSIYTSVTVVLTLSALYLWGGVTTKDFVLAMLIGIVSGTYSSIFCASAILVWWREKKAKPRKKAA